jgi:site-specific DNA recombinase
MADSPAAIWIAPALARLMTMIREGQIDIIVIYKIDRLTRSLTDFARLAETFDKHGVSFVSVTQQFNTTTSMGRLMLNVLLSFAQFEREITGERIRDKIAASKKKGMWMGGPTPMGYDVKDRQLVINPGDAEIIRSIFQLYLEEGSVPALLDRLERDGIRTVERLSVKGNQSGGRSFTRGHLYKLLSNPIYIGRIPHKRASHPGMHEAIIDRSTWDNVQSQLADNTQGPRARRRRAERRGHLLAGILVSERGNRFIPTHANKGARQYRYYVEEVLASPQGQPPGPPALRLPENEIEGAVIAALKILLTDNTQLLLHLGDLAADQLTFALRQAPNLVDTLSGSSRREKVALIETLLIKATFLRERLDLEISTAGLRAALGIPPASQEWPSNTADRDLGFTISAPLIYRRRGVQAKLIVDGAGPEHRPDRSLQESVARGWTWFQQLATGERTSIAQISEAEGITGSKIASILDLAFLTPHLVDAIVVGSQPASLSAAQLIRDEDIPLHWEVQRGAYR